MDGEKSQYEQLGMCSGEGNEGEAKYFLITTLLATYP